MAPNASRNELNVTSSALAHRNNSERRVLPGPQLGVCIDKSYLYSKPGVILGASPETLVQQVHAFSSTSDAANDNQANPQPGPRIGAHAFDYRSEHQTDRCYKLKKVLDKRKSPMKSSVYVNGVSNRRGVWRHDYDWFVVFC